MSQNISVLQQVLQNLKVLQQVLPNFKSIAILIAKSQKYCNKDCKISKVLQYLLQNLKSISLSIAKSQSIAIPIVKYQSITILCNTIGNSPRYKGGGESSEAANIGKEANSDGRISVPNFVGVCKTKGWRETR